MITGLILVALAAVLHGAFLLPLSFTRKWAWAILPLNFPTFSRGLYARDRRPRGQVADFRVPICIGWVLISPGDIVFGDLDGVAKYGIL